MTGGGSGEDPPGRGFPYLCDPCWKDLPWLAIPGEGPARQTLEGLDHVWAACRYEAPVTHWIRSFKYQGYDALARLLAALLHQSGAGTDFDWVVPVPLHSSRLRERGFNQSLILAHHWLRGGGWNDCEPPRLMGSMLERIRATLPQVRLSGAERAANVTDAFALRPRGGRKAGLAGRRVLLVDDVLTTGATLGACAQVLREGGAVGVSALVVSRVTPDALSNGSTQGLEGEGLER